MKIVYRQLGWMLAVMSLVLCSGGTALADDTELFIAGADTFADDSEARPNILFIIDTSGSMDGDVITQVAWDPEVTYAGDYRDDAVYWSTSADGFNEENWFYKANNLCQASWNALDGLGVYEGDLLAYRSDTERWVQFNTDQKTRDVECEDDAGVHGSTSGTYYAADGATGPWASNNSNEPSWTRHYYLFDGNYLNWQEGAPEIVQTRLEVVQQVTINLLENLTGVNVGLMRFNISDGGPVVHAMENIETSRTSMQQAVSDLDFDLWTPLSETLYEAHQYYSGGSVVYGEGYTRDSVDASRTGNTYDSPIEFGCQKNYIILLSDGEPTRDTGAESRIEGLPNFDANVDPENTGSQCEAGEPYTGQFTNPDDGICLDELAEYMHNKDLSDLYGAQNVTTYTIGFTIDLDLLETTAEKGGGKYYLANDTATLSGALTKIAVSILEDSSSFAAPSVPVNAFNRTQSLNDIFVSVFNPSSSVHWPGNVKKYKLIGGEILDARSDVAVDPDTGFFKEDSKSYWSADVDGDNATDGGAASNLPATSNRKLYTDISGGDLNSSANRVQVSNSGISANDLGAPDSERDAIINWMNGLDVFDANDNNDYTDTRRQMGDPLHVRPVPVIYGGTADEPDMVVYISTNDGYLHAIDPDDGSELWAWVPERLLDIMYSKYTDDVSTLRVYGLDGEIAATIVNDDNLGGITGDERVILVFGMRRGGGGIFALDVTDRNDPQLLWEIDADSVNGSNSDDYEDLGQTWSTPQFSKVKVNDDVIDVVMFGGGYDAGQDDESIRTDNQGNAVYIVNLLTGAKIWSAGDDSDHDLRLSDMDHSIPAPLRVIDINSDGLADRIYVGDMGGRVWRFDIFNGNLASELVQGGMIASIGASDISSPTTADVRRFYNQVDVVSVPKSGAPFYALNIGSGYRAHPLDRDIDEEFYSIRDFNPVSQMDASDYGDPILRADLVNITTLPSPALNPDDKGWRLSMNQADGEKVLSRAITFDGVLFFTSFSPGSSATACAAAPGENRLYAIDLLTGAPLLNRDESEDTEELTETDRYTLLKQGSIAPQVEILFGADNPTVGTLLVGPETPDADIITSLPARSYWTQDGAE